jgi:hypothetical protein
MAKSKLLQLRLEVSALDFVDKKIGRSLRDLIMKIEFRQKPGQQLFHAVDETWNHNEFNFAVFPNLKQKLARW